MNKQHIENLLQNVASGSISVAKALESEACQALLQPKPMPSSPSGAVQDTLCGLTLDTARQGRTGLGEVVFAPNKSDNQLISAMTHLFASSPVLATRLSAQQNAVLQKHFPQGSSLEEGRLFSLGMPLPAPASYDNPWPGEGDAIVISAGGADRPVALEAYGALHFWGIKAGFIADVGVAGLHRLTPHVPALQKARIIIAVAGMEGALPGIIAGFVRCPVVAVPTSVGYGVGAHGKAALSSMLCSCVPGIAVCNIDNGFGAAAFAAKSLFIEAQE